MGENITLTRLLEFNKITYDEYKLLFEDKSSWNSEDSEFNKAKKFWEIFSKVKNFLKNKNKREKIKLSPKDSVYNFSYIHFPDMESSAIFEEYIYPEYTDNDGQEYTEAVDFSHCVFYGNANFSNNDFSDEVKFNDTVFYKKANFSDVSFGGDTYFKKARFYDEISFENSECKGIFDFSDTVVNYLTLDKSNIEYASYLRIKGYDKKNNKQTNISSRHFSSKESARIIKAHFEKQNNIIESNIFYPIEMDKFREELVSKNSSNPLKNIISFFTNQNYFVTTLSKYVSNYGTSWVRAGIVILFFSFFFSFLYENFQGQSFLLQENINKANLYLQGLTFFWLGVYILSITFDNEIEPRINKHEILIIPIIILLLIAGISVFYLFQYDLTWGGIKQVHNYVATVANPFGVFKSNDVFKGHESFGTIVRLIILTLIYQFIVAFRQNTRRK